MNCTTNGILDYVGYKILPPDNEEFIAKIAFEEDAKKYGLKFHLPQDFLKHFGGLIEPPQKSSILSFHDLKKDANDNLIISSICCEDLVKVSLRDFFRLHRTQYNGPNSPKCLWYPLLTNSCLNVFHIPDVNKEICILRSSWYGDGWFLKILDKNTNYRAYVDTRFFSF